MRYMVLDREQFEEAVRSVCKVHNRSVFQHLARVAKVNPSALYRAVSPPAGESQRPLPDAVVRWLKPRFEKVGVSFDELMEVKPPNARGARDRIRGFGKGRDAFEATRAALLRAPNTHVRFVLWSGSKSLEFIIELLRSGASVSIVLSDPLSHAGFRHNQARTSTLFQERQRLAQAIRASPRPNYLNLWTYPGYAAPFRGLYAEEVGVVMGRYRQERDDQRRSIYGDELPAVWVSPQHSAYESFRQDFLWEFDRLRADRPPALALTQTKVELSEAIAAVL